MVMAQDDEEALDEITVTGSAIKREELGAALPLEVLSADYLERTGITSAADMIESVPAMQGFFTESDSVGGGGGGIRTANLRGIGSQYTLVLLDGRRMAPAYSGSDIDLSNIPLAAVDQVHILKDGAGALYGADAISGVVNFILKDSVDETTINVRADQTETSGGERWNMDIVTGFGDVDENGFGVVLSYSHDDQDQLKASERDFAKTGFVFFEEGADSLYFQNSSANAIPGNSYVYSPGFAALIRGFNPNGVTNGTCANQTTPDGETCRFDYTSTLEVLPESERDSLTLNGRVRFTDNLQGFATILASQYEMTARIAPYPTGEIPLWSSSQTDPMSNLVATEVWPHLTAAEQAAAGEITGTWRALPAGNRTTTYAIDSYNYIVGIEGSTSRIDYTAAVTHATTEIDQDFPTGWLLLDEFVAAGSSGAFNIFAQQEDFTDADAEALAPAVYHGDWDENNVTMTGFDLQGSMPLWEIGGGDVYLAAGADYRTTNYERTIADANRDELLLFLSKDTAYDLDRDQYGVFVEALFPITDTFETTLSVRFDDISAVEDVLNGGDIDQGDSDTTYKISALWNVSDEFAFRASYGTGFKAPSMREIGEPRSEFGVTSGTFVCPFSAPDPLAQFCRVSATGDQYDVFREGSAGLTFESSTQYSFGVVLTPSDSFNMTLDYWNIELEDLVERLTETQIFDDPVTYRHLYSTKTNLATGQEFLAIIQAAINAGTRDNAGIDYALNHDFEMGWGDLQLGVQGTYMIDSVSSLTGSSLGQFGNDDGVVFRNIINFIATLDHGDFTHTLFINTRDSYLDQEQQVEITGTGVPLGQGPTRDVQLEVPSYTVTNYQLRYMMLDDSLGVTFGVSNLLDEEPPLSLRVSGSGHQVGWDPRFTDPYGRTFYLQAQYAFAF
jgi:iron complex outermembrane receptor protein